ncbi:MAG TPA: glycosyltransferase family 1 protein [Vicinamibacteria bacterium]
MKIGVDVRELQRTTRTGIGRVVENFISETPSLDPAARLFLYADDTTRTNLHGERIQVRVLGQPTTVWFDQIALPAALARDGVDVFFSPYYKAPLAAPCPSVITIHDVLFLKVGGRRVKNLLFKPWARLLASRVARVLTDSEHSRHDLQDTLGFQRSRIEVVPLGVSSLFSPTARQDTPRVARKLGLARDYILSVTNFRGHKNDELLVRAFATIASQTPDIDLVLAGRAAVSTRKLEDLVDRLELGGRVVLSGLIPDEDLPALYAGARVFAFPSLYEGFGLPVLEAMASGVPVACSNSSSLPEIASEAALLLDPRNVLGWTVGLRRLLTDEPLRKTLVEAGLTRARGFSWRNSAARILSVLAEVSKG